MTPQERKAVVTRWLETISAFGRVDLGPLWARLEDPIKGPEFVAAFEAVLLLEKHPWTQFERARDFCVSCLLDGSDDKMPTLYEPHARARLSRERLSPFSVPPDMLCAAFTKNPNDAYDRRPEVFDPRKLHAYVQSFVLEVPLQEACSAVGGPSYLPRLITTAWARVVPPIEPLRHRVEINDLSTQRRQELHLWALVVEPLPLFIFLPGHNQLELLIRPYEPQGRPAPSELTVLFSLEGWEYDAG